MILGDFNSTGYILKNDDFLKFENFINRAGMKSLSENLGCTSYWKATPGDTFNLVGIPHRYAHQRDEIRRCMAGDNWYILSNPRNSDFLRASGHSRSRLYRGICPEQPLDTADPYRDH